MLKAKHQEKFLKEKEVRAWAYQLADALIYLHTQNPPILHRDIKPSNLKLMPSGLLKLVDFGLVKVMAPGEMTITIIQGQGTALYTPLEQYGGDSAHTDIRSDIYSFGATFYHLLTNTPPADARERFIRPDSLKSPRSINPSISQQMDRAILWALNLHPDERPQNMMQLKDYFTGQTSSFENKGNEGDMIEEFMSDQTIRKILVVSAMLTLIGLIAAVFF
jgi:serine/threonine-protein kinase